jgi:hypothetical protein
LGGRGSRRAALGPLCPQPVRVFSGCAPPETPHRGVSTRKRAGFSLVRRNDTGGNGFLLRDLSCSFVASGLGLQLRCREITQKRPKHFRATTLRMNLAHPSSLRVRHPPQRSIRLRKRVQTRLRSCLAAAYSAEVAFGYEGRACVSPHFLCPLSTRAASVLQCVFVQAGADFRLTIARVCAIFLYKCGGAIYNDRVSELVLPQ